MGTLARWILLLVFKTCAAQEVLKILHAISSLPAEESGMLPPTHYKTSRMMAQKAANEINASAVFDFKVRIIEVNVDDMPTDHPGLALLNMRQHLKDTGASAIMGLKDVNHHKMMGPFLSALKVPLIVTGQVPTSFPNMIRMLPTEFRIGETIAHFCNYFLWEDAIMPILAHRERQDAMDGFLATYSYDVKKVTASSTEYLQQRVWLFKRRLLIALLNDLETAILLSGWFSFEYSTTYSISRVTWSVPYPGDPTNTLKQPGLVDEFYVPVNEREVDWQIFTMINWNIDFILSGGLAAQFSSNMMKLAEIRWMAKRTIGAPSRQQLEALSVFSARPVPKTSASSIGVSGTSMADIESNVQLPEFAVLEPFVDRHLVTLLYKKDPLVPNRVPVSWDLYNTTESRDKHRGFWPGFHDLTGGMKAWKNGQQNTTLVSEYYNAKEDFDYFSYDAVYALAKAMKYVKATSDVHAITKSADQMLTDKILSQLDSESFEGASGKVEFQNRSRVGDIEVRQWRSNAPLVALHKPGQNIQVFNITWYDTEYNSPWKGRKYVMGTDVAAARDANLVPVPRAQRCYGWEASSVNAPYNSCNAPAHLYNQNCQHSAPDPEGLFDCFICPVGQTAGREQDSMTCESCPRGTRGSSPSKWWLWPKQFARWWPCFMWNLAVFNHFVGDDPTYCNWDCVPCPKGYFSHGGDLECSICEAGSFAPTIESRYCDLCPPGQYQSERGQSACESCPGMLTTEVRGSSSLDECACPVGTYIRCLTGGDAAADVDNCNLGRPNATTICEPCPVTPDNIYTCPGGMYQVGEQRVQEQLVVKAGYFVDESDPYRAYKCWSAGTHCKGGRVGFGRLSEEAQCGGNRKGRLCGKCKDDHFLKQDGSCEECGSTGMLGMSQMFFVLLLISCFSIALVISLRNGNQVCKFVAAMVWFAILYFQTFAAWGTIAAEHLPAMAALYGNLKWMTFDLGAFDMQCLIGADNYLGLYVSRNLVPWFLLLPFGIIFLVGEGVSLVMSSIGVVSPWFKIDSSACLSSYCLVWTVFFVSIVQSVIYPLKCRPNRGADWSSHEMEGETCGLSAMHYLLMCLFALFNIAVPMLAVSVLTWQAPVVHHLSLHFRRQLEFAFTWWKREMHVSWFLLMLRALLNGIMPSVFQGEGICYSGHFTVDFLFFVFVLWCMPAHDVYSNAFLATSFSFIMIALTLQMWTSRPLYEEEHFSYLNTYFVFVLFCGGVAFVVCVSHMLLLVNGKIVPKRSTAVMGKVFHIAARLHEYMQFDREATMEALNYCMSQMPSTDLAMWTQCIDTLAHSLLGDTLASSSLRGIKPRQSKTAERLSKVRLTQLEESRSNEGKWAEQRKNS